MQIVLRKNIATLLQLRRQLVTFVMNGVAHEMIEQLIFK